MNLLINDKEVVNFLVNLYCQDLKFYKFDKCTWPGTHQTAEIYKVRFDKIKKVITARQKAVEIEKIKKKIQKYIIKDLKDYLEFAEKQYQERRRKYFNLFHKHIDRVFDRLGEENIFNLYKNHKTENFIKNVGLLINPSAKFVRRKNIKDYAGDSLLRNTVHNEQILVSKIRYNTPFWFIDSGYTNFLETHKKWHRLVRNHIHNFRYFDAPSDRLGIFSTFPSPWRNSGHIILIIEPGPFSAAIFDINLKEWKKKIEEEIRLYSDKKIVFREKHPKKVRKSLFKELKNEDYYCVININSNAATESIWSGIPAITLDKHITNFVTSNKISEINNLSKPPLGNWLSWLSYSQFTFEELMNGTAVNIIKKYYA